MSTIGTRVKEARKAAGITQGELAQRVGATQQMISELERGNAESSRSLVRIAAVLSVSATWLETGEGSPEANSTPAAPVKFGTERPRITIADSAMMPRFSLGDTVYYEKGRSPEPGNFVVVKISDKVTLRKYRVINRTNELTPVLTPMSEDYPEIEAAGIEILGVAAEHVITLPT